MLTYADVCYGKAEEFLKGWLTYRSIPPDQVRQHTSAYVSIRQHTSAYVAYVSIRPRTSRSIPPHQVAVGSTYG